MDREMIERYVTETVGGGLTCKEFVELVTDYLEESLSFSRWVRFQLHLGICPGCRTYVWQMKDTVHRLGTLRRAPPSDAVRQELQWRFQIWTTSRAAGS